MNHTGHVFADRQEAGRELACALRSHLTELGTTPSYVLAVPRGGVPVASEIATALDLPLDLKLVPPVLFPSLLSRDLALMAKRARSLRGIQPPPTLEGHAVLLVTDWLSDGRPVRRMVEQLRIQGVRRTIVVTPLASPGACETALASADGMVCLSVADGLEDASRCYRDARPVTNDDVRRLLVHAALRSVTP